MTTERDIPVDGNRTRRSRIVVSLVAMVVVIAVLYGLVPQIPDLRDQVGRLRSGDVSWLAVALVFELLSFGGYVVVFHTAFAPASGLIGWRASYEITMAGVVTTRLLAFGGAGGIALTAWALARARLDAAAVREQLAAFLVLLYSVFLAALVVAGAGLRTGLLPGPSPFGLTVVPAAFGVLAIAIALAVARMPPRADDAPPRGRVLGALAIAPATLGAGVRGALTLLRRREPGLLGALAWWGFDIAVLWACLHAFGAGLTPAALVVAYFVGLLGSLLPLPGGIGGVEGGMIGTLLGFGVAGPPAILAVLAYRAFAFWLPIAPGALAYVGLMRTVRAWDQQDAGLRRTTDAAA